MIDLTLDSILIPDLTGYMPPFGTKVARTAVNKGGLSTQEVNNNIIASFVKMRGVIVTSSDQTSLVEYDAKIIIESEDSITLTLGNATYKGCRLAIVNNTTFTHILSCTSVSTNTPHILPNANIEIMWNGSAWQSCGGKMVGDIHEQKPQTDSPFDIFPCSDWEELISHNAAFYRAANAPKTLYTIDETKWFRDSELENPVNWVGIKNSNGTNGTVSNSGTTTTNSKGQVVKIFTGSWSSGMAAAYINKSGNLITQEDTLQNHSHQSRMKITESSGISNGYPGTANNGMVVGNSEWGSSQMRNNWYAGKSFVGVIRTDQGTRYSEETRPVNLTVKVWKRIN